MTDMEPVLGITSEQAARAEHAIARIDGHIARETARRQKSARVYKMPRDEYQPPVDAPFDAPLNPDWIKGASRHIYDYCLRTGRNTTIECAGWAGELYITVTW